MPSEVVTQPTEPEPVVAEVVPEEEVVKEVTAEVVIPAEEATGEINAEVVVPAEATVEVTAEVVPENTPEMETGGTTTDDDVVEGELAEEPVTDVSADEVDGAVETGYGDEVATDDAYLDTNQPTDDDTSDYQ